MSSWNRTVAGNEANRGVRGGVREPWVSTGGAWLVVSVGFLTRIASLMTVEATMDGAHLLIRRTAAEAHTRAGGYDARPTCIHCQHVGWGAVGRLGARTESASMSEGVA